MNRQVNLLVCVAVVIAGGMVACGQDLPPLKYETARAQIGTDFDDPLCAADLAFIDRYIKDIERRTGERHDEPVELYIYNNLDDLPCDDPGLGCYDYDKGYAAALWDFIDHEIVHAVTRSVSFPSLFWNEGLAVALSIEGTHRNRSISLREVDLREEQRPDYSSAGHFVRFLLETYSTDKVNQVIRGYPIEDVVGLSAAELVQQYEQQAPYAYPAWEPCPFPEIPAIASGTWEEQLRFSCKSEEATQFEGFGASIVRRLSLDEPGTYEILVSGGKGVLMVGCQTDVLDEPSPDFANGDIQNQAEASQTAFGTFFPADEPHQLSLTAGIYRLALSSGTNDEAMLSVEVRRM